MQMGSGRSPLCHGSIKQWFEKHIMPLLTKKRRSSFRNRSENDSPPTTSTQSFHLPTHTTALPACSPACILAICTLGWVSWETRNWGRGRWNCWTPADGNTPHSTGLKAVLSLLAWAFCFPVLRGRRGLWRDYLKLKKVNKNCQRLFIGWAA